MYVSLGLSELNVIICYGWLKKQQLNIQLFSFVRMVIEYFPVLANMIALTFQYWLSIC